MNRHAAAVGTAKREGSQAGAREPSDLFFVCMCLRLIESAAVRAGEVY